ncbi:MAG: hypothetical protein ABIC57_02585 [bacterium]
MKILVAPGTNLELYYLSSVVILLSSKDKSIQFKLLAPNFVKVAPELKNLYSEIEVFHIPSNSPKISKNPIKMAKNIYDNMKDLFVYQKQIKRVLADMDIVCIAGVKEFFANVICRIVRDSYPNIRLVAVQMANQKLEEPTDYERRPILSFLLNIKNFLFGYSTMKYKWSSDSRNRLITKNFVKYPYCRKIFATDHDIRRDDSSYRLPPPYPALRKIHKIDNDTPIILVAGERIPLHDSWGKKDQEKYGEFLNYLRDNFKNYKLCFKPRKGETISGKYNLEGFRLIEADSSLEEICLRENIKKVISIKSVSSKFGAYLGIPSYWLYPLFGFSKEIIEVIENEHCDMKSVVRVNEFEDLKKDSDFSAKKYDFDAIASLYWEAVVS